MYILYFGLTFLVAYTITFAGHDVLFASRFVNSATTVLLLRYVVAACIVGLFFWLNRLPRRLPHPIRGRNLVLLGTVLYCVNIILFNVAINVHSPGTFVIVQMAYHISPLSMIFILWGAALALLGAGPSHIGGSEKS